MATMIIDYGDGTQETIHTPDNPGEVETSARTKELSRWLRSSMEGILKRRAIVNHLEEKGWKRTSETQPMFDTLHKDIESFKGSPIASRSDDFYEWIDHIRDSSLLPESMLYVIEKSPDAVVNRAIQHLESELASSFPAPGIDYVKTAPAIGALTADMKPRESMLYFERSLLRLEDKRQDGDTNASDSNELTR